MIFQSDVKAPQDTLKDAYWFLFYNDEILIKETQGIVAIPLISGITELAIEPVDVHYIGSADEHACYIANLVDKQIPAGFSFKKIRQLFGYMEETSYWLTFRAFHLNNWIKTHHFCGCCGGSMNRLPRELALKCDKCGHIAYPRISPAIIVAVTKGSEILLARSNRFPPGRYSVIAGFVEPGETLEECVKRELQEEVGISVTNIKYFGNQPWPFPDSLMVAFTATWLKGDIHIDNEEIVAAEWFTADTLPPIPPKDSIARQLIDWFVESQAADR